MNEQIEDLEQRLSRIAAERQRVEREEQEARIAIEQKLGQVTMQIESLQKEKQHLEALLGTNNGDGRGLRWGELKDACLDVVRRHPEGLTSREVADILSQERPGMITNSVPATLSRQMELGALVRDHLGRYKVVVT